MDVKNCYFFSVFLILLLYTYGNFDGFEKLGHVSHKVGGVGSK
jgi:hypothetical protein